VDAYETQVRLEVKGKPSTQGTAKVQPRTVGERVFRALKLWAIFFACAVPTVIFPPHVIIPSLIIVTGTVLSILRFKETESLLSLDAPCPTCGATGKLKGSGQVKDGRPIQCEACGFRSELKVLPKVVDSAAAPATT
jgi:hypothetical protein